jgi:hypothetical protein
VTQSDSAAAAAREAAPDDTGLWGSRGSLGGTWAALRVALWFGVVCAVTAALVAVPAGAIVFFCEELSSTLLGEGVDRRSAFRDTARMQRREPYTVEFDWSTTTGRWAQIHAAAWEQVFLLFFPVCYVAYLGASLKVCCVLLGSAVLASMVSSAGFVVSGKIAFLHYSSALAFALLVVSLKILCPRNSKIPTKAIKQALVLMVGNVLFLNVIPETTVRTALLTKASRSVITDPCRAQDLVRFMQTFVLLNLYREMGRIFTVSAAYYLTVADVKNAGVAVNRDAAVAPVIVCQTLMTIVFRLEVANFDDPQVALATCLLQGVLEVVLRLTAPERDAWVKRVSRRFAYGTGKRRGTTLVVAPSPSVAPVSQGQPSSVLAKPFSAASLAILRALHRSKRSERIAAAGERDAVVKQFRARMILVDMWAEFAGIYIGSLLLFLGQSLPLYYTFRPYRKHPELLDGGNYYGVLAVGAVAQIVIEIITDTVCLVFEARRGLAPLAVWRELPKAALTPIILFALMFATVAGSLRSLYGDSVDQCNHRDVCWCVGDGLLPGGVRENYCLLLYPNSSGRPTN